MVKTPKDANGGTPISSEVRRRRNNQPDSQRSTSMNALASNRTRAREDGIDGAPFVRARDERRRRREHASAEQAAHRASVNVIRPTSQRERAVLPLERETSAAASQSRGDDRAASANTYVVPEDVKRRFVQVGNKYHFPDGARAFTDHGKRLTSPSENSEVIKSLVSIAQARGWSDITISGTERFRREAWFAARVAGLGVRGYSPNEFEQGRLVRMLAREQTKTSQSPAEGTRGSSRVSSPSEVAAARHSSDAREDAGRSPPERRRALQVGRLVDHGAAPYLHDPHNAMSYFVRIESPDGEREIWGVDMQRALKESLTRPKIGDEIGVRALRRDAVKVFRPEHDETGRVVGEKTLEVHRNAWIVEKRDFFRERAQAARVLRDSTVDRQTAVKQHPELLGTYLQLHAAELAAKTLRNPEDQRRFVASVRAALADSVARGEPLPPVPLKETAAERREPRAPKSREREGAPAR